jgi:hypothetical protein
MKTLSEAIADARAGKHSSTLCPAHEDRNPSLSVRPPGPRGWIGIKCFAGCDRNDVLAAGGVALHELGPERPFKTFISPSGKVFTYSSASRPTKPLPRREPEPWNEARRLEMKGGWPVFRTPSQDELTAIAQLRDIPIEALQIAVQRGILRVIVQGGDKAVHWVVTDAQRHVAQKRSFDGSKLLGGSGPVKALNLLGSATSWPVGLAALKPEHRCVLLVEGGPDLLAAFEFIRREEREADTHAIAMLGAKARIHPSLHHHFNGRTVRIIQHSDEAGEKAGRKWGNQLLDSAEHVEVLNFGHLLRGDGSKVNDLNDALLVDQTTYNQEPHLRRLVP